MIKSDDWRSRIKVDPQIHRGDPCIAGTRVPVSIIVGSIAEGDPWDTILASFPQLKREDIQAALCYAAEAVNRFEIIPLGK